MVRHFCRNPPDFCRWIRQCPALPSQTAGARAGSFIVFFTNFRFMATVFSKLRAVYNLFKHVDLEQLARLAAKMPHSGGHHREPPPIEGDFYHLGHLLTESQRALQLKVRAFMEEEIKPIVNR